jgi:hypothetical protein
MPASLLLLCLLFRSSWLTVEGNRHVGAAGVLHRRGGRVAVAVSVGVAGGVPDQQSRRLQSRRPRLPQVALCGCLGPLPSAWEAGAGLDLGVAWCSGYGGVERLVVGHAFEFVFAAVGESQFAADDQVADGA